MDEEKPKLAASTSEGASLGNLLDSSIALSKDKAPVAGAGADKRAAEKGLFTLPEPNSKRQRQSRYIVVDGHAVLRENNYGLEQGFISVFEGGEFQTGEGKVDSEAIRAAEKSEEFYINSAGEVSVEAPLFFTTTLHLILSIRQTSVLTTLPYPLLYPNPYSLIFTGHQPRH
jgi:hypothetical protein